MSEDLQRLLSILEFPSLPVIAHIERINTTPRLEYHADMIPQGLFTHSHKRTTSPTVINENDPMLKLLIDPYFQGRSSECHAVFSLRILHARQQPSLFLFMLYANAILGVPICEDEEIVTHAFFPTRIVPELRGSQSSLPLSSESESSIDSSVLCRLTCFDDL